MQEIGLLAHQPPRPSHLTLPPSTLALGPAPGADPTLLCRGGAAPPLPGNLSLLRLLERREWPRSAVAAATSGAVVVALSAAAAAAASSRVGESATRRRFLARCGQISLRLCRCDAAHTLPTRRIARGVSMRPPPAPGWKTLVICGRCEGVCVAARHALPGWRAPPLLTR